MKTPRNEAAAWRLAARMIANNPLLLTRKGRYGTYRIGLCTFLVENIDRFGEFYGRMARRVYSHRAVQRIEQTAHLGYLCPPGEDGPRVIACLLLAHEAAEEAIAAERQKVIEATMDSDEAASFNGVLQYLCGSCGEWHARGTGCEA